MCCVLLTIFLLFLCDVYKRSQSWSASATSSFSSSSSSCSFSCSSVSFLLCPPPTRRACQQGHLSQSRRCQSVIESFQNGPCTHGEGFLASESLQANKVECKCHHFVTEKNIASASTHSTSKRPNPHLLRKYVLARQPGAWT